MRRYTYTSISDPNRETVGTIVAHNHENAIRMAAEKKQLDIELFMTLYVINEIVEKTPNNEHIR